MVFTAICTFGFLFVCVALPFALRFEAHRRKTLRQTNWVDSEWSDDSQLAKRQKTPPLNLGYNPCPQSEIEYLSALEKYEKYPNQLPAPFPPPRKSDRD
jgi:hypothetical protein